jgi:hypothetical protein
MEVSFSTREKISLKSTPSTWEYPFATSPTLNFSTCLATFIFFLNTHLLPTCFLPLGNLTKSHDSFLYTDSISSTMVSFQSLPFIDLTSSPIDLGSSSMEVNMNVEWNLRGIYLSIGFITLLYLLIIKVNCSTTSSDPIDSSESSSSFLSSNHTISGISLV